MFVDGGGGGGTVWAVMYLTDYLLLYSTLILKAELD